MVFLMLFLYVLFRKLCLVWLVEILDTALNSGVLATVSKHVSLDAIAQSILPSSKYSYRTCTEYQIQVLFNTCIRDYFVSVVV